jgi:hypothetical protein
MLRVEVEVGPILTCESVSLFILLLAGIVVAWAIVISIVPVVAVEILICWDVA